MRETTGGDLDVGEREKDEERDGVRRENDSLHEVKKHLAQARTAAESKGELADNGGDLLRLALLLDVHDDGDDDHLSNRFPVKERAFLLSFASRSSW